MLLRVAATTFSTTCSPQEAARSGNTRRLEQLWVQYRQRRLPVKIWMLDAQISCHARRNELSQAVHVFNSIKSHGLLPSSSSYYSLLHAYSKVCHLPDSCGSLSAHTDHKLKLPSPTQSGHPPYGIDASVALEAETVFKAMVQAGHRPTNFAFHWLMETQVTCS